MATISYVDIGAVQRRSPSAGSPVAKTSYVDIGAAQVQEVAASGDSLGHYVKRIKSVGLMTSFSYEGST